MLILVLPVPSCATWAGHFPCLGLTSPKTLGPGKGSRARGLATVVYTAEAGASASAHDGVTGSGFTLLLKQPKTRRGLQTDSFQDTGHGSRKDSDPERQETKGAARGAGTWGSQAARRSPSQRDRTGGPERPKLQFAEQGTGQERAERRELWGNAERTPSARLSPDPGTQERKRSELGRKPPEGADGAGPVLTQPGRGPSGLAEPQVGLPDRGAPLRSEPLHATESKT